MASISRIQQYEVQTGHILSRNHAQSHQFRHQDPQPPLVLWLNRVREMRLMLHLQGCRSDGKKNILKFMVKSSRIIFYLKYNVPSLTHEHCIYANTYTAVHL